MRHGGQLILVEDGKITTQRPFAGERGLESFRQASAFDENELTALAREQISPFRQQEPEQLQIPDALSFFAETTTVTANDERYEADRSQWFSTFARGYSQESFNTLDDYMRYVMSQKDDYGQLTARRHIQAYIQKQARDFMPAKLKQQLREIEEQQQFERKFQSQVRQALEAQDSIDNNDRLRGRYAWDLKKGLVPRKVEDIESTIELQRMKELRETIKDFRAIESPTPRQKDLLTRHERQLADASEQRFLPELSTRDKEAIEWARGIMQRKLTIEDDDIEGQNFILIAQAILSKHGLPAQ